MRARFDIAVIGSGFGGSLLAMIARRIGRTAILLEKASHPRFAIGESATPLANLLLEELATRYSLSRLLPLTKWGTWQRAYTGIACGLKRGFTFYHHTFGERYVMRPDRSNQLLVAASPRDEIADTHWYRADVDHFLVQEAQDLGVEFLDRATVQDVTPADFGYELAVERQGRTRIIRAGFIVDATGPRGCLHRLFGLPETASRTMPKTQGLYTHFTGVRRLSVLEMHPRGETTPYPVDDAAVHHVFPGGWIWVLRFNNGVTSAGVAAVDSLAEELRLRDGASAWNRLLQCLPAVREQFAAAEPCMPFVHAPRLSFQGRVAVGESWALLPSAAGFVDPLLSTGIPLTLLGVQRLAEILEGSTKDSMPAALKRYEKQTLGELAATRRLIGALYASMNDFPSFISLSMLYFAAASYAEAARRLQRPQLAQSFLLADHPQFGKDMRAILRKSLRVRNERERERLARQVQRCIEPINVAGLCNRDRKNWYSVEAQDLLDAAAKLKADSDEIRQLLVRTGFDA